MKIVVIGGSGLIGSRLVNNLREMGHDAVSASPKSGVNAVTGEGLAAALEGAQVVVDVSNSPSFEDKAVLAFFESSTRNLLAAEAAAGVGHHVALSIVGADRLPDSGYMRAKVAQEKLIKAGKVPYTIVRATQFFEFIDAIGGAGAVGKEIHLPPAMMQPIAAKDVSAELTKVAVSSPANGTIEVAGPEPIRQDELVRTFLAAKGDQRPVVADPAAQYFGTRLDDRSLVPSGKPHLGKTHLAQWMSDAIHN
ncbi:MAG TPA: SDR family oxidoreductase [Lacipirellulaceae bacterium]|nr:SDR family oxidoreductase [Lacipirellulaceae bacterium]